MKDSVSEEIVIEKSILNDEINRAKKMQILVETPEFKELFNEGYVDSYALTQVQICGNYNPQQLQGMAVNLVARSKFTQYIQDVIERGKMSVDELTELNAKE